MIIHLMRHGDYHHNTENLDVLTPKGIHEIGSLSKFLIQFKIDITEIIHSQKNRAKQTATMIADQQENIVIREQAFIAPGDDPLLLVDDIPSFQSGTLVVSHLPYLGRLVSLLVLGHDRSDIIDFQPGTFVSLIQTRRDQWIVLFVWTPQLCAVMG